jgi:uncharacterized protein YprB with RNaseH-like and TPR domain
LQLNYQIIKICPARATKKNKLREAAACTPRQMLAFDIETTGLDPASSVVTVVCTQAALLSQVAGEDGNSFTK